MMSKKSHSTPVKYEVVSSVFSPTRPLSIVLKRTPLKDIEEALSPKKTFKRRMEDILEGSPSEEDRENRSPPGKKIKSSNPFTPLKSQSDYEQPRIPTDLVSKELNGRYWSDLGNLPSKRSRTPTVRPGNVLRDLDFDLSPKKTTRSRRHSSVYRSFETPKKSFTPAKKSDSDVKNPPLTSSDYFTPVKIRPRKLLETPKTKRSKLRAPSVTPSKRNLTEERIKNLIDLSDTDEEEAYKPIKDDDTTDSSDLESPEVKKKVVKKKPIKKLQQQLRKIKPPPIRKNPLPLKVSSIQEAQLRLHVSAVPDSLPCREDEFAEIYGFTQDKIASCTGGCMYISGVPGTGKTATVKEVIRTLQSDEDVPVFKFVEINGMRLTDPNQIYSQLWKELNEESKPLTTEHAHRMLDKKFTSGKISETNATTILLVDELDMLCTARKQNVLYNLFDWPNRPNAQLVVLAIANTMDLPERMMINRVSSRLGLTRLTFSPYTHQQLQEIVISRLKGLEIFDNDAVQLVSRKVASLSGDARRALDICRRATELAERRKASSVTPADISEAHKEMFCSPKIASIRSCSTYEKLFLKSVVSEFHRSGIEETTLGRCYSEFKTILHYEGKKISSITETTDLIFRLSAIKLILAEPGIKGLELRIRLNVSIDDVLFALNSKEE